MDLLTIVVVIIVVGFIAGGMWLGYITEKRIENENDKDKFK
jgi:hypothetical protein